MIYFFDPTPYKCCELKLNKILFIWVLQFAFEINVFERTLQDMKKQQLQDYYIVVVSTGCYNINLSRNFLITKILQ